MAKRRRYMAGKCGDCGRITRITQIRFWVNDFRMWVCADCIKSYRDRILSA